ncbi:MAG TPA: type II toxin-antitoxin system prevent-host-death family antitoxin, partial [Longimicrobiales bacterium]|nr:type II toxin-antitoxin system prevent-host-death family antitoxin [Longimicrobiales bacterium]
MKTSRTGSSKSATKTWPSKGERYAEGFGPHTPQISWSQGKSIAAALLHDYISHVILTMEDPMSEERVSVATLKARLSEYLSRAEAGEAVVVTHRGTPVARLGPLEGATALAGRVEELARAGLVRRPAATLDPAFVELPRPSDPEG